MRLSNKNIRATSLDEFWGGKYEESVYLWQGSKNKSSLKEINNCTVPTCDDIHHTQQAIQNAHEFCVSFYYEILILLSNRLNAIHKLDYPVSFWQMVLGYWLYRHISVVYDKYLYLSGIDLDNIDIGLLSKSDFYIPESHSDYLFCFATDFGVQQLVSQYFYLYKNDNFRIVSKKYVSSHLSPDRDSFSLTMRRFFYNAKFDPQVALLDVYFSEKFINQLTEESKGDIGQIFLPSTAVANFSADLQKREYLSSGNFENKFQSYFLNSLYYCFPKQLLENFMFFHDAYIADLRGRQFKYIVSEAWISSIPTAIYIALAKLQGILFVAHEHSAFTNIYKNGMQFIDYDASDIFLTTGWKAEFGKAIQGGFTCRDVRRYDSVGKKIFCL